MNFEMSGTRGILKKKVSQENQQRMRSQVHKELEKQQRKLEELKKFKLPTQKAAVQTTEDLPTEYSTDSQSVLEIKSSPSVDLTNIHRRSFSHHRNNGIFEESKTVLDEFGEQMKAIQEEEIYSLTCKETLKKQYKIELLNALNYTHLNLQQPVQSYGKIADLVKTRNFVFLLAKNAKDVLGLYSRHYVMTKILGAPQLPTDICVNMVQQFCVFDNSQNAFIPAFSSDFDAVILK